MHEKELATNKTLGEYQQFISRKLVFIILTVAALMSLIVFSVCYGAVKVSLSNIMQIILGNGSGTSFNVIYNIRLPRVFTAVFSGMGLGVAGVAMQSILRNPLGSPYTLGISHAAAFGAAFAVIILGAGTTGSMSGDAVIWNNPYTISFCAFIGSLISTFVILLIAKWKRATPETMILTGVALGSLFTAGFTALQYFASDVEIAALVFWTFGDVGRTTWNDLGLIIAVVIPSTIYFTRTGWNYSIMDAGDDTAKSLGVNVDRLRVVGMLIAGLVSSVIVSFCGIIGFVGLVVPHIVRKVIGGEERFLIPASCLMGGLLLLAADTAARTVIAPIVLPVGIVTSFLGAPLFIYLVLRGRREYW